MPAPLSSDLRERIVRAVEKGSSIRQAALRFEVSPSAAVKLMRRVRKRSTRPLLQNPDPEGTMRRLMDLRYPVYATADITIDSHEAPHDKVVNELIKALREWFEHEKQESTRT